MQTKLSRPVVFKSFSLANWQKIGETFADRRSRKKKKNIRLKAFKHIASM